MRMCTYVRVMSRGPRGRVMQLIAINGLEPAALECAGRAENVGI